MDQPLRTKGPRLYSLCVPVPPSSKVRKRGMVLKVKTKSMQRIQLL